MKTLALWLVTLLAVQQGWRVDFEAHPLNVGLQLDTECKGRDGKLGFRAIDYIQIEPTENHLITRRQVTPKGERCTVVAKVFRNTDGAQGDPDRDYAGESSIVVEVQ